MRLVCLHRCEAIGGISAEFAVARAATERPGGGGMDGGKGKREYGHSGGQVVVAITERAGCDVA